MERWKEVLGYEGLYIVNTKGIVISVSRKVKKTDGFRSVPDKVMAQTKTERGYLSVSLNKDNYQKTVMVHNIVASAFIENPFNKPFVNHKDFNKQNNSIDNLEWVTASENIRHAIDNGRNPPKTGEDNHMTGRFNELNHNSRPVKMIGKLGMVKVYPSAREAARQTGANFKLISACAIGRRKTHKGFQWQFS